MKTFDFVTGFLLGVPVGAAFVLAGILVSIWLTKEE